MLGEEGAHALLLRIAWGSFSLALLAIVLAVGATLRPQSSCLCIRTGRMTTGRMTTGRMTTGRMTTGIGYDQALALRWGP